MGSDFGHIAFHAIGTRLAPDLEGLYERGGPGIYQEEGIMAGVEIQEAAWRLGVAKDTGRRCMRSLLRLHHPSESLGDRLLAGLQQVQTGPRPLHGRGIGRPSNEGAGE